MAALLRFLHFFLVSNILRHEGALIELVYTGPPIAVIVYRVDGLLWGSTFTYVVEECI